jgi:RNA-binding protein YhbY
MIIEGKFQIGKGGITSGVIRSLNLSLKTHNLLRISTLKSATRDRDKLKEMAESLIKELNYNCKYRLIGYTILLRRQSARPMSKK